MLKFHTSKYESNKVKIEKAVGTKITKLKIMKEFFKFMFASFIGTLLTLFIIFLIFFGMVAGFVALAENEEVDIDDIDY